MFFQSAQHQGCLQKLEMAIHLKRGLSVVVGDIGTGKSTLCRQLIRIITQNNDQIIPYLILDPEFTTPLEFLLTISKTFTLDFQETQPTEWQLKDTIKKHLLTQAIENQKILALIIDEGQKLPGFCVELLREFLNFETNQHKLLQIVIFAQEEFISILQQKPNFADRITTYQHLKPLSFKETRAMIDFRLDKAHTDPGPPPRLFSLPAIVAIFCLTRGYPRRIVMLCSKIIITILVSRDHRAGLIHVFRAAKETSMSYPRGRTINWRQVLTATGVITIIAAAVIATVNRNTVTIINRPIPLPFHAKIETPTSIEVPATTVPVTAEETVMVKKPAPPPPLPLSPSTKRTNQQASILGSLEIERGVSLSKMIARVYGRYSPIKLPLVLAANPQITDPDQLPAQTEIHFPVLAKSEFPSIRPDQVYLELSQTTRLSEAYAIVKDYPETAPQLLIIPTPTTEMTFLFHVIMEESFNNDQSALAKTETLPRQWRSMVKTISGNKLIR
ncbi:MAG: AAA family ATPase [Proteobacteria bacterium]|nr:AAA family ATPase [Pseudomonadota bacterium]